MGYGYLGLALLFVMGVFMLVKPELLWKLDHMFTVKNGEPTELYLAVARVIGAFSVIIPVAVAAFLLIISVAGKTAEIPAEEFSFVDLKDVEFWFGSGAGGWRTVLTIEADGSFSGEYSDSELGSTGEDYPDGTVYYCEFSGKFTEPVAVNEYTYSMQIAEISYENEPETEEIRDGQKYIYTEPYGLEDAENILIYLPGTLTKDIPEECVSWLTGSGQFSANEKKIPFYALNNEVHQEGFSGNNIVDDESVSFYAD